MNSKKSQESNPKINEMGKNMISQDGEQFTTEHGVPVNDSHNSLKAGERGPTLLEDFIVREKLAHFDRERIPERVVHARGTAAHGIFKLSKDLSQYTRAHFLTHVGEETPVFLRFSTVAGFRGSTDLARDVRGFAIKFYTQEGNFDLVGNNIPVFFIQDAMKFPDLVHAVKPEPENEMPQAASAHDTFWDFISLTPESAHMIMWTMSDRAIPRSFRMMEGFGVHTYKLVNAEGKAHFVKFHWKPKLGVHSVAWDEAQKISGKNSDFHREDLYENISKGNFPEWELGLQIIPLEDELKYGFDILDPTKLIPEELVPVEIVGTMTLNKAPENFFAEVEQVGFSPANIVPGIDYSNDPLLQGRIFSYTDTQLHRLGGSNFTQIPINRPLKEAHNTLRDGQFQHRIFQGKGHYTPNSLTMGCPHLAKMAEGGFTSDNEKVEGQKIRTRSESFLDHYSQAKLFYNSQSEYEKMHIKNALSFELSKCTEEKVKVRVIQMVSNISLDISDHVAKKLGLEAPKKPTPVENFNVPADADPKSYQSIIKEPPVEKSEALSMENTVKDSIETRQIAVFVSDGFSKKSFIDLNEKASKAGAECCVIAPTLGKVKADDGTEILADKFSLFNTASVLFDSLYIIGGEKNIDHLMKESNAAEFANDSFKHCKIIGYDASAQKFIDKTNIKKDEGIVMDNVDEFLEKMKMHRFWDREQTL